MSLIPSLLGALLTYGVVRHVLMFFQNLSTQSLKGRKQCETEYLQSFQTTVRSLHTIILASQDPKNLTMRVSMGFNSGIMVRIYILLLAVTDLLTGVLAFASLTGLINGDEWETWLWIRNMRTDDG